MVTLLSKRKLIYGHRMKLLPVSAFAAYLRPVLFCIALNPAFSNGEVRLLTGDSNNAVHQGSGDLKDLSADGNLVLFLTGPPVSGSTPGIPTGGLYLRNISANTLEFVGDTTVANTGVAGAEMSDDGRYLTWASTNTRQIYWRDRSAGLTRHVTVGANGVHGDPRMSADGRYVAFVSTSRNIIADTTKLPDTNRGAVYVYDSVANSVVIATLAPGGGRLKGVATFTDFDISGDGRFVVYAMDDPNAHPDKAEMTASFLGIFRRNISTGEVVMVNRNSSGAAANGNFNAPRLSADGSRVIFGASFVGFLDQKTMIPSYSNLGNDVYVKDVTTQAVWLATKTPNGVGNTGFVGTEHAISDNGAMVAFASSSDELIPGSDSGGGSTGLFDVFRADLGASGAVTLSQMTKSPTDSGNVDYRNGPFVPGTGNYVAFGTDQVEEMGFTDSSQFNGYQTVAVGTFPAVTISPLALSTWAMNLPAGMRAAGDNPSGDGVKNALKYYIGSDATRPDLSHLPSQGTATGSDLGLTGDSGKYLTLSVRIRREVPVGYTWSVVASETLTGLVSNPVAAVEVGVPVADGDFDIRLFRFPSAISASGAGFMRLNVSVP